MSDDGCMDGMAIVVGFIQSIEDTCAIPLQQRQVVLGELEHMGEAISMVRD